MRILALLFSFICCGVSFIGEVWTDPWPEISTEAPDKPGNWWHRAKNMAVETVRSNANWFTKALACSNLLTLAALALTLICAF